MRLSKENDEENHYRELLLLYRHWRKEGCLMENATSYKLAYHLNSIAIDDIRPYFENDATTEIENIHIDEEDVDENDQTGETATSVQYEDAYDSTQNNQDMPRFTSDIGMNFDRSINNSEAEISRITQMNNAEFLTLVRQLNLKQRFVFDAISDLSRNEEKPYYIFITGGPGNGKTQVLKAIVQQLLMIHKKGIEHDPEKTTILLCAPIGKAAFNIGGSTLRYALSLSVSQELKNFKDLTADKVNQLRVKLTKLKLLIIDKVSMVGANMFEMINRRLKRIMGTQQDFGGVSILFFGDLYQLQPVADRYVFQPPTSPYEALLPNFWQDNVIMFELNRTEEDIQLFQTSKFAKAPLTVQHLFISNTSVDKFNAVAHQNLTTEKKHYTTKDSVKDDIVKSIKQHLLEKTKHLPISETQGLPFDLRLAIKKRVELTVEVSDHLANGSGGTVQALSDSIIWILFKDKHAGEITRNNFKSGFPNKILRDWTPIFRTVRMFRITKKEGTEIERFKFPLRPSSPNTVHKAQGDTLAEVAIDLICSREFPHVYYVS